MDGEHPVVSPELALVDPELAAAARLLLDLPQRWTVEPPAASPVDEIAAPPARAAGGRLVLVGLLCISLLLNGVVIRFAWDDGIAPKQVLGLASVASPAPVTGAVLGAQVPPQSSTRVPDAISGAMRAAVGEAVEGTTTTANGAAGSIPSPASVENRVLGALAGQPNLRRYVGTTGIPLPGVSAQCASGIPSRDGSTSFRCTLWRGAKQAVSRTAIVVRIGRDGALAFVGVRPGRARG